MKYLRALFVIVVLTILVLSIVRIAKAENNLLGTGAGGVLTTGHSNTILGEAAGMTISTGIGNIFIGYGAGHGTTTGSGNVYLGYMAGYANTTSNYKLAIQHYRYPTYGIFGDFTTGYFGINKSSPTVALDVTGTVLATAFTGTGASTISPSLTVRNNTGGAGSDSSLSVSFTTGSPVLSFFGSDGDTYTQGINTSDKAVFAGAGGGYGFDAVVSTSDTLRGANGYIAGKLGIGKSPTRNLHVNGDVAADSAYFTLLDVDRSDVDSMYIETTGDPIKIYVSPTHVMTVTGATGGYSFDNTIALSNGETISNSVNGTVQLGGKTIAVGDSHAVSAEALVENASEADTNSFVFVGGKANVYGSDGDNYSIGITTGDAANFTNAGGGYLFDGAIDGTDIINTTIGAGGASSGAFTTLSATTSLNYVADVLAVTADATLTAAMSGRIITNTGSANGDSLFLPTCASGLTYEFISSEADSMIIQCASGDSIFDGATTKPSFEGHAANASFKIVGLPTAGSQFNWIVRSKNGTWAGN